VEAFVRHKHLIAVISSGAGLSACRTIVRSRETCWLISAARVKWTGCGAYPMFTRVALTFCFLLALPHTKAVAQVTPSTNLGCTVIASGGMSCNGIGVPPKKARTADNKHPDLSVTHFIIEPGAALDRPTNSCDVLILGIAGGELVNERPPAKYLSLAPDSVILLPKGRPFRLRNTSPKDVELRLIEIEE